MWLRYQRDLRGISKETTRTRKRYARIYDQAVRDGKRDDELFAIAGQLYEEVARLEDQRSETMSIYLVKQANALRLPTPDYLAQDSWEISHRTGMRRLNEKALARLQAAVRDEKKARLQLWEQRIKIFAPTLTGLTGLIGALIGLMTMVSPHN